MAAPSPRLSRGGGMHSEAALPQATRPGFVFALVCIVALPACSWLAADGPPISASELRPDYDPAVHDPDPVKEFGVARSAPIHRGFFFHKHRYVEGPYVVERRGLAMYVNGILMGDPLEWPPFDGTVDEDPGDPPAGVSPLDPTPAGEDQRNDYWSRKGSYLWQHHSSRIAFRKMVEAYRKCDALRSVRANRRSLEITLVDKSGRRLPMHYFGCGRRRPLKRDDILARAEYRKKHYEKTLAAGRFVGRESGFASEMGHPLMLSAMDIMNSDWTADEKIKVLEKIGFLEPYDKDGRETVRRFKHSAELAEKVRRLRRRE